MHDYLNLFKLFVAVQEWIGYRCTMHEEPKPNSMEILINLFKMQRTTQEMRRHK